MERQHATVWEAIADVIGDEDAIVQGARRRSWAQWDDRAARLASAWADVGVQPTSKIALFLYNGPEYLETSYSAFKQRAVPVNVNYRYLDDELHHLLDDSDSEVVVFHSSLGERIDRVRDRLPGVRRWVEVDDDGPQLDGADRFEDLIDTFDPAPRIARADDDLMILYTGGTTGLPKGVLSTTDGAVRVAHETVPALVGQPPVHVDDIAPTVRRLADEGLRPISLTACPLMHGTGSGLGANPPLLYGGTVVLLEGRRLDPTEIWDAAEREHVTSITVVGDPFARPMLRALDDDTARGRVRELPSLRLICSAGAMFSREVKDGLCEHVPHLAILDVMASSEAGMGQSVHTRERPAETARFALNDLTRVLRDDDTAVEPDGVEVGMLMVRGGNRLGYHKDPEKTARTFREIGGEQWTVTGDFATVDATGHIMLLGRGSGVINTAGEKVFAEEVEEAVKTHPAVADCLVVGVADDRFGQRVVAVASPAEAGARVPADDVIAHVRTRLASFKAPKQVVEVATVPRAPNGKADYPAARELAVAATGTETTPSAR